jgi:signal transduction histidine kinase/ligand-binding sensor domain-containing protein
VKHVTHVRCVLFACALGVSFPALALNPALDIRQYGHTSWKIRDGFFKSRITVMAQTADGYLWLGTELGLLRFDGSRSVPWQPAAGQSLPHRWIRSLYVGRDGTLWIGTLAGLASVKDGTLRRYPEISFIVDAILEDRGGTVWAGGGDAALAARLCALRAGRIQCSGNEMDFGRDVTSLYEDDHGALWVTSTAGLWQWSPGDPQRYPLPAPISGGLQPLTRGENGGPLVATHAGISEVVRGRIESRPLRIGALPFSAVKLLRDRDGGLWVGSSDGGLRHIHQGRADAFAMSDGLSGDFVNRFFEDREGNVWVATLDGLDRFRELAVTTITVTQGLPSARVSTVLTSPDGSVLLNANGVLTRWKNGRIAIAGGQSARRDVESSFRDGRGRVWVATTSAGIGYLENDQLRPLSGVPSGSVSSIAEDTRGVLWIANQTRGLIRVSPDGEIQAIPWANLGQADPARRIVADPRRGGLWLGFFRGGLLYYSDGKVRETYSRVNGLGGGRIDDLRMDRDGALWASSEDGLSRVKDGRVATLTTADGLPCANVQWTIEDDTDALWLRMECGLGRITSSDLRAWIAASGRETHAASVRHVMLFDSSDGVRNRASTGTFNPRVDRSVDGRLWFVDSDGVSVVDPRHLLVGSLPPPVHVEQIIADRKTYAVAPPGTAHVRLPPMTRDLQIDYTAISLVAPEKIRFRYRLEGRDREWQDAGNRRQAFYNDLAPGAYRFRVIASNNSGIWNEEGATVAFVVAPAYYQTTWFVALVLGAVVSVIWTAHRVRLRIVETHEREIIALNERLMRAQEQERTRIAGELHDGVMQEMLAATMMLGTAKRRIPDGAEGRATIDKVQQKLIQVGTDLRQLSHELHPPMLQQAGLPNAVRAYCEEFSAGCGVPVSCDADDAAEDLSRGAALALFRILQEALGNAAKHARATQITVRLTRSDVLSLVVSDDGVGFDRTRLGTSRGLGLITIRERAGQLNGKLDVESEPGRGTKIAVTIPFR